MKVYVLILVLIMGMWSCEDFLTIRPKSDITEEDLFAKSDGVEDALYGVYARLGHTDLYGQNMTWGIVDMPAQYFKVDGQQGQDCLQASQFTHDGPDARATYGTMWTGMYEAIGYANNVINALTKKDESSMKYYSIYLGEALGVRGFLHFDLIRLFAPHVERQPDARGIPYVRQWTSRVTPFSTVQEVYTSVLKDLKESERLLTRGMESMDEGNDFTNTPQLHFNLYAAQATLARVYWMKGDLDSACIYARKVIDSEKFELVHSTEVKDMVAQVINKKECIWGIFNDQLSKTYGDRFYGLGNVPSMSGTSSDLTLYPNTVWGYYDELYPSGDNGNEMRLGWIRGRVNDPANKKYFMKLLIEDNMETSKPRYGEGNIAGIHLIRLPEMYLIVAEALLEKESEVALDYFDTFIASRGLYKFRSLGKTLTLEDIDKERKKEFFGEGQEFYNMKREMRDVLLTASSWGEVIGSEEMYTFLIPDSEFEFRYDDSEENNENQN